MRRMQTHGAATTAVDSATTLELLKRWQQGDKSMYEDQKVKERFANRGDEEVREALNLWWQLVTSIQQTTQHQQQASPHASPKGSPKALWQCASHRSEDGDKWSAFLHAKPWTVDEATYSAVFLRIQRALLEEGDAWDREEAEALITEAWLSDTNGRADRLTRTEWNDSLFELAECAPRGATLDADSEQPFRCRACDPCALDAHRLPTIHRVALT